MTPSLPILSSIVVILRTSISIHPLFKVHVQVSCFFIAPGVKQESCFLSTQTDCTCSVTSQLLPGTKLMCSLSSSWAERTPSKVKDSGFHQ